MNTVYREYPLFFIKVVIISVLIYPIFALVNSPTANAELQDTSSNTLEGTQNHTNFFRLRLNTVSGLDALVHYTTRDGTATAGEDYIAVSGVATIPADETEILIGVEILADTEVEGNETFHLVITRPTHAQFPSGNREMIATHTIIDSTLDTVPPFITLNGSPAINIIQAQNYTDLGASATDNVDNSVNVIRSGSVDTQTLGTYILYYTATDQAGNTARITRTVTVIVDPDVITITESKLQDCLFIEVGGHEPSQDELKNIQTLTCLGGPGELSDMSELGQLTNLRYLDLRYNNIDDLSPLANLKLLNSLDIGNQFMSQYPPHSFSDLTPLTQLTQLTSLYFSNNRISDLTPLSQIYSLTRLSIVNARLRSDVSALSTLVNLTHLNFNANQVSDMSFIVNLTNLEELIFPSNFVSNLEPLANLVNLTKLMFRDNQVSDISPLSDLLNLTYLSFYNLSGDNQVVDISPLANLRKLTYLDFSRNQVVDVSSLAEIKGLIELRFHHNKVKDVNVLGNLNNLTEFSFGDNEVTDISGLLNLSPTVFIYFSNNCITDFSVLAYLSSNISASNYEQRANCPDISDIQFKLELKDNFEIKRSGSLGDDLTWVIEKNGKTVLERNASNELEYTYYNNFMGGSFRVWLKQFMNGQYEVVSNIVTYDVINN